jgi:integrase
MPTDIHNAAGQGKRNIPKKKRYPVERETEFLRRLRVTERPFDAIAEAALFEAIAKSPSKAARQLRLLTTLMLETAAFLNELVAARWEDFDLAQKLWAVPARKYSKTPREVPLSAKALSALAELRALPPTDPMRVFPAFQRPFHASLLMSEVARKNRLGRVTFPTVRREAACRMVVHQRTWTLAQVIAVAGGRKPLPPPDAAP